MKRMLLGVGNRLSRDDGVGPAVAQALADSDWISVDCGTALENASGLVSREKPDLLVVVDAATMDQSPGAFYILPIEFKDRMLASTHGLPLSFVLSRIESSAERTILIGIQPEDMSFGEGLSSSVQKAALHLAQLLREARLDDIPTLKSRL